MQSLVTIIVAAGYVGITLVVFAESGLFFGFFLPGDSLLFTAGLFASHGEFNILVLVVLCLVAAILGDSVGYYFGKKVGPKIFARKDSFLFKQSYVAKTKVFYERHGDKAIVLARFVPIVRTFVPIMAGVGEMPYRRFVTYNIAGGALWVILMLGLGYVLGEVVPDIDRYILPIIALIVVVSVLPAVFAVYKEWKVGK